MKKTIIAAALLAMAGMANAASYSYSFSDVQNGQSGSSLGTSKSIASLTVSDSATVLQGYAHAVSFSLTNTFADALVTPTAAKVANLTFSSGALGGLQIYGTGSGFSFKIAGADFFGPSYKVVFNTASGKSFDNGETANWTVYGNSSLDASDFSNFLMQVNATGGVKALNDSVIAAAGTTSIHFAGVQNITAPVPEPETYAMLLAGLGLMGTIARRRQAK